MKKVFIQTQFGKPHEWTQQYIDHVQHLEESGWYWKIFTPNKFESKGNVEIVPMTIDQFNVLTEKKLRHRPKLFITDSGIPSVHITDFYIFSGIIFEDYLKDAVFWGITNLDVVYGRLSHFLHDEDLDDCDVFSDDVNAINGVFSLWRNISSVNNLFKHIGNWDEIITQDPCEGCVKGGKHGLFASDEFLMTDVMKKVEGIRYLYPAYYPMLSHDRLKQHVPDPQLEIKKDHSLWEKFYDIYDIANIGKEIMYFHFSRTKKWPKFLS